MADPKWDDTEDIQDIPSFEDTEEIIETQPEIEPSTAEALGRGAVQGATLGLGEEIGSALLTPAKAAMKFIPGTPEYTDAQLREQGFTGDIESQSLLDQYRELRDTAREADKAAQKSSPIAYGAGQIGGAILPTLALGGAGAAGASGQVASKGLPLLGKIAAQGAVEGAIAGAGESEADLTQGEVGQFAEDVGTGAALGGAAGIILPAGAKVAGKGIKKAASGAGELLSKLPGAKAIKTGYELGKKGVTLDEDVIKKEIKSYSEDLLGSIKKSFKEAGLEKGEVRNYMDEVGIRINAGEPVQEIIDDVISRKAIGLDDQRIKQKVVDALESFKGDKSPVAKAIKRMEKRRAKLAAKMEREGAEIKSTTPFEKDIEEVLPLPETEGKVMGFEDRYLMPDGSVEKKIVTDVEEALAGPQVGLKEMDLENLSYSDAEDVLKRLADLGGDLKASPKDEMERRARQLAIKIKERLEKTLEGDPRLSESNTKLHQIFKALERAKVKGNILSGSKTVQDEQVDALRRLIGSSSDEAQIGRERVFEYLGKSSPEYAKKAEAGELLSEGLQLAKGEAAGTTSLRGLLGTAQKGAATVGNIAGIASQKAGKLKPVQFSKNILKMSNQQLQELSSLADTKSADLGKFSPILKEALSDPDKKDVILWTLSRQPAFRESLKRVLSDQEEVE